MKNVIRSIFSKILNITSKNVIKGKLIKGTNYKLYYEKTQFLNFLFQNKIAYETEVQPKISKYIRNGDLIFDIGSNIGQYAIIFSDIVKEKGKVICYEPDYKNYSFLTFNLQINNIKNIELNNVGMGDKVGSKRFYKDSITGGRKGSFIKDYVGSNYKEEYFDVKITTLDNEVEKYGVPNFVKMDVEGFEYNVLCGLTKKLTNTVFLIEVRDNTKDKVFNFFSKDSYNCYLMDDTQVMSPKDIPDFANLLFVPKKFTDEK